MLGAVVGGACLGLVAGLGAAGLDAAGLTLAQRAGIGAALAVITAGIDLGMFGIELPIFKRQVNDAWLRNYRSWVYGSGFGWQIGFGVATYIMTAGILLMIALAVLTVSLPQALGICVTFGAVRGSAVYIGRNATSTAALRQVHARLERLGPASRIGALGAQVLAAVGLAALSGGVVAAFAVAALIGAVVAIQGRGRIRVSGAAHA